MKKMGLLICLTMGFTFIASCLPEDPPEEVLTKIFFVQSQEREDEGSESAYYKDLNCQGETTDNPLTAKSVWLDAYLYRVEIDPVTNQVTGEMNESTRIGAAKVCGSNTLPLPLIPVLPVNSTFRGTFTVDKEFALSEEDMEISIDGNCRANALTDDDSWAAQGSLTACDVDVLPNPAQKIIGGKGVSNSIFGALTEQSTGSLWVMKLILDGDGGE